MGSGCVHSLQRYGLRPAGKRAVTPLFSVSNNDMMIFIQQILNGLMLGCTYALVALGYTLIFGLLRLIHMAHGEVLMIGAYVALTIIAYLSGNLFIAMIGSMILTAAREREAPLRRAPFVSWRSRLYPEGRAQRIPFTCWEQARSVEVRARMSSSTSGFFF